MSLVTLTDEEKALLEPLRRRGYNAIRRTEAAVRKLHEVMTDIEEALGMDGEEPGGVDPEPSPESGGNPGK